MRTGSYHILFILLLMPVWVSGQQSGIDQALQKGRASDLGFYFANTVEVSIPGIEESFTPDKAVSALDNFFSLHPVKGYKRVHLSTPQQGRANYSIGDLYTANGTYRITLYFDAKQKINEIRIQF